MPISFTAGLKKTVKSRHSSTCLAKLFATYGPVQMATCFVDVQISSRDEAQEVLVHCFDSKPARNRTVRSGLKRERGPSGFRDYAACSAGALRSARYRQALVAAVAVLARASFFSRRTGSQLFT